MLWYRQGFYNCEHGTKSQYPGLDGSINEGVFSVVLSQGGSGEQTSGRNKRRDIILRHHLHPTLNCLDRQANEKGKHRVGGEEF